MTYTNEKPTKLIPGFPKYVISETGEVFSLYAGSGSSASVLRTTPKILSTYLSHNGYVKVSLFNGVRSISRSVHNLVLIAFVGPRPEGHEGAHLDGDKQNNARLNLAWVTKKENARHTLVHGTRVHGQRCGLAKLKDDDVPKIIQQWHSGDTQAVIGARYGVCEETIGRVCRGVSWRGVRK